MKHRVELGRRYAITTLAGFRNHARTTRRKRITAVAAIFISFVLLTGIACIGDWSDVPDTCHAAMPILRNEATDSAAATVYVMGSSEVAFARLYSDSYWSDDAVSAYWERIHATCIQKWGANCNVLYVMVVPTLGREGEAAWWPWNIIVTQDQRSYSISLSDSIVGLSSLFHGRVYCTMDGLILLPREVNVSRPFQIDYSTEQVSVGPLAL